MSTEQVHPNATPYESALCALAGCGQPLHMILSASMPVYLTSTAVELADPANAYTQTWRVECEAGHVILLPPDNAADNQVFGACDCDSTARDLEDAVLFCAHNDLSRLRQVLRGPDDDGTCRKEGCPNLGGVWRDCPENADG